MERFVKTLMVAGALLPLIVPAIDAAENNNQRLRTDLSGFNEVHPPTLGIGAIFSTGSGLVDAQDRQAESRDRLRAELRVPQ